MMRAVQPARDPNSRTCPCLLNIVLCYTDRAPVIVVAIVVIVCAAAMRFVSMTGCVCYHRSASTRS